MVSGAYLTHRASGMGEGGSFAFAIFFLHFVSHCDVLSCPDPLAQEIMLLQ